MSKYIDAKYDIIINTKDMSVTVDHTNPSAGVHRSDGGKNCTYNVWSGKATASITKID